MISISLLFDWQFIGHANLSGSLAAMASEDNQHGSSRESGRSDASKVDPDLDLDMVPGRNVAEWVKEQAAAELARVLAVPGTRAISIPVNNTAIMHERTGPKKGDVCVVNRVECRTAFDFNRVHQVLVSPAIPCPHKRGFNYVNVILFAGTKSSAATTTTSSGGVGAGGGADKGATRASPVAMLVPYLYDAGIPGNELTEWVLINSKAARARLSVPKMSALGGNA